MTSPTHPQDPPSEDLALTQARAPGDVGDPSAGPESAVAAVAAAAPAPSGVATPAVTVILVLRNGAPWLPACLDGLAAQRRPPERLVAVDIASSDGSAGLVSSHQSLAEAIPRVEVVPVTADTSFAGAIQAGIARLGPDAGSGLVVAPARRQRARA